MLEKRPELSPTEIKRILIKSAIDVKKGQSAMGDVATPGWDPATGAGLVNAKCAWLNSMADVAAHFTRSGRSRGDMIVPWAWVRWQSHTQPREDLQEF